MDFVFGKDPDAGLNPVPQPKHMCSSPASAAAERRSVFLVFSMAEEVKQTEEQEQHEAAHRQQQQWKVRVGPHSKAHPPNRVREGKQKENRAAFIMA